MVNATVSVSVEDDVGIILVDHPPVNTLSAIVRIGMAQALDELIADDRVQAIVLMCGGRTFFAGADISEFGKPPVLPTLHDVMATIEDAPKPIVAAIHGNALGGGLETALVCHWRVAMPSARVGLPEVHLGLLPGGGGTQRLPRLIGLEAALELMLSGQAIKASQACDLGILDAIVEGDDMRAFAIQFARVALKSERPLRRIRDDDTALEDARAHPQRFETLRKKHAALLRGFKAPGNIIKAVEAAATLPFDKGLEREWELFRELEDSSESSAQRHIFFAERETAKVDGIKRDTATREISKLIIVGDEAAGSTWRSVFAGAELPFEIVAKAPPEIARHTLLGQSSISPSGAISLDLASSLRLISALPSSRLIEIDRADDTPLEDLATVLALLRKAGRIPMVASAPAPSVLERMLGAIALGASAMKANGAEEAEISAAQAFEGLIDIAAVDPVTLALVNECTRILDERAVSRASDLDVGAVLALGWPVYRGGPLFWADLVGLPKIITSLQHFAEQNGPGFTPAAGLIERAANGQRFNAS